MGSMFSRTAREGTKGIPPGPSNPFAVMKIPSSPAEILTGMSHEYGPVFSYRIIGSPLTVVLNNYEVIKEAVIDNADALPTRMTSPLRHRWGIRGRIFYSLGEDQKTIREFVHQGLKDFQDGSLYTKVSEEARHLCQAFEKADEEAIEPTFLLTLASGNIMSILNFGRRFDYEDRRIIELMEAFDCLHHALVPGTPVQQFPWLYDTYLYRELKQSQEFVRDFVRREVEEHKSSLDRSNPRDFIDLYLMRIKEDPQEDDLFTEERAWYTIKDVFSSSSNPTASGLQWMIAMLCHHQDMQQKIYEEVADVIGSERLPAFGDLRRMPFTHAFMTEVLRFRSVVPLGTREVTRDMVIAGYDVPQGSWVLLNFWAAARDPKVWQDPDQFLPERFLSPDGTAVVKPKYHIPLGMGHRDCMGQTLAMLEMFLFGTNLVQKFHLKFDPNENPPSLRGVCGATVVVEKFKLSVTKRA